MTGTPRPTAGLLLAAGSGSRMGHPKALVRLGGEAMVVRSGRVLAEAGCDPVIIVIGAAVDAVGEEIRRAVAASVLPATTRVVVNPDWSSGMASSLRTGLHAASDAGVDGVVVHLVDLPDVHASTVHRLMAARERAAAGTAAWVASYDGEQRNPALFDGAVIESVIAAVRQDAGARRWLEDNDSLIQAVPCEDIATPDDLDTPEQVDAWLARQPPGP